MLNGLLPWFSRLLQFDPRTQDSKNRLQPQIVNMPLRPNSPKLKQKHTSPKMAGCFKSQQVRPMDTWMAFRRPCVSVDCNYLKTLSFTCPMDNLAFRHVCVTVDSNMLMPYYIACAMDKLVACRHYSGSVDGYMWTQCWYVCPIYNSMASRRLDVSANSNMMIRYWCTCSASNSAFCKVSVSVNSNSLWPYGFACPMDNMMAFCHYGVSVDFTCSYDNSMAPRRPGVPYDSSTLMLSKIACSLGYVMAFCRCDRPVDCHMITQCRFDCPLNSAMAFCRLYVTYNCNIMMPFWFACLLRLVFVQAVRFPHLASRQQTRLRFTLAVGTRPVVSNIVMRYCFTHPVDNLVAFCHLRVYDDYNIVLQFSRFSCALEVGNAAHRECTADGLSPDVVGCSPSGPVLKHLVDILSGLLPSFVTSSFFVAGTCGNTTSTHCNTINAQPTCTVAWFLISQSGQSHDQLSSFACYIFAVRNARMEGSGRSSLEKETPKDPDISKSDYTSKDALFEPCTDGTIVISCSDQ